MTELTDPAGSTDYGVVQVKDYRKQQLTRWAKYLTLILLLTTLGLLIAHIP